ncbi:type II toxin-antitoxin system HicB family antitoxin [Nocardiopsis synnemataformans]|uniref:type II toxin-antitoxin system HicB family antitoxin n=1 Tax=Nocardiopsis synnemataformans TaxID=61305 RepID=UPI003EBE5E0B
MEKHKLTVVTYREEDQYVSYCVEADIASFGETRAEAEAMIIEALELNYTDQPVPPAVDDPTLSTVEISVKDD